VTAEAAARAWADAWSRGWREKDAAVVAARYAEDAVMRSLPFREPRTGRQGVFDYAAESFAVEDEIECWFGEPIAAGDRAAVEYWATLIEEGREVTFAGVSVLRFDAEGLVAAHADYWVAQDGRTPPYENWGGGMSGSAPSG
jgi:ketosteroid isomerase-like protein